MQILHKRSLPRRVEMGHPVPRVARILAGASAVTVVSASLALAHAGAASASPSTLMYSLKSDRSNAQQLYGATIPQNAYVFTPTASGVKSVRFVVDGKVI